MRVSHISISRCFPLVIELNVRPGLQYQRFIGIEDVADVARPDRRIPNGLAQYSAPRFRLRVKRCFGELLPADEKSRMRDSIGWRLYEALGNPASRTSSKLAHRRGPNACVRVPLVLPARFCRKDSSGEGSATAPA